MQLSFAPWKFGCSNEMVQYYLRTRENDFSCSEASYYVTISNFILTMELPDITHIP